MTAGRFVLHERDGVKLAVVQPEYGGANITHKEWPWSELATEVGQEVKLCFFIVCVKFVMSLRKNPGNILGLPLDPPPLELDVLTWFELEFKDLTFDFHIIGIPWKFKDPTGIRIPSITMPFLVDNSTVPAEDPPSNIQDDLNTLWEQVVDNEIEAQQIEDGQVPAPPLPESAASANDIYQVQADVHEGIDFQVTVTEWFCVANINQDTVTGPFYSVDGAKSELNKIVGSTSNRQMVCEMSASGAKQDPHIVGGVSQGGGFAVSGFQQWWNGWDDINLMNDMCENDEDCQIAPRKFSNLLLLMDSSACPSDKFAEDGNTITKTASGSAYDTCIYYETTRFCVKPDQSDMHVRMGLTSDYTAGGDFNSDPWLGFFLGGRLYIPALGNLDYSTDKTYCMVVEGQDVVLYEDDVKLHTFVGAATDRMYGKLWFYESGSAATVVPP